MRNYITPLEFEVYHTHTSTYLEVVEGYSIIISLILIYAITAFTIIRLLSSCLSCEVLEPIPEEDYTEDEEVENEQEEEEVTNEVEAELMDEEEDNEEEDEDEDEDDEDEDEDSSSDYEETNTDTDNSSEAEERIRQANLVVKHLRQRRGLKRLRGE